MSKYFDPTDNRMYDENGSYYFYIGGRGSGRKTITISHLLEFLFGGRCEYNYDPQQQVHHYSIKNDDIGFMDLTVTNECFMSENGIVLIHRMCEEYDAYMRYKYRDYMCRERILNEMDKYYKGEIDYVKNK